MITNSQLLAIYNMGDDQPAPPAESAGLGTQLLRGGVRGLTMNMLPNSWAEGAGLDMKTPGGLPETLANLLGFGVGFAVPARIAGAGVAGAGSAFPSLLAKVGATAQHIPAAAAASSMLRPFGRPLATKLSGRGGLIAGIAAMGLSSLVPDFLGPNSGEDTRTTWEKLADAGLGMAMQGGLSHIFGKRAGAAKKETTGPKTTSPDDVVSQLKSNEVDSDYLKNLMSNRESLTTALGLTKKKVTKAELTTNIAKLDEEIARYKSVQPPSVSPENMGPVPELDPRAL